MTSHNNSDRVSALRFLLPSRLSVIGSLQAPLVPATPQQIDEFYVQKRHSRKRPDNIKSSPRWQICWNQHWNPHRVSCGCNIDDSVPRCILGQPYSLANTRSGESSAPYAAFPFESHACSFPLTPANSLAPLLQTSRPVACTTMTFACQSPAWGLM